jgi:hypothetical protein
MSLETRMSAAYQAGRDAGARGAPVADNPHDPNAASAAETVCAQMWVRGYGDGNPMPDPDDDEGDS